MPSTRHVEHHISPGKRLGRRPADPNRKLLHLGRYLTGQLPTHPSAVDYFTRVGKKWCLGRNTEYGTCGPTSLANLLLLVSTWLADTPIKVTDADIIDLYRRSGNPDFNPATGAGDNGVDMTVMLAEAVRNGIGGYKPLAFAAVNGINPEEVWATGALFGGSLWGADLAVAQDQQTSSGTWDFVPSSQDWGGHAILAAGRYTDVAGTTNDRTGLVSWQMELTATDAFITHQVRERYVVIWPWHLGSRTFLAGVNVTLLAADYQALTGREFPSGPVPVPAPGPAVDPADVQLATALNPWAGVRHVGSNERAAAAYRQWKRTKNL